MSAWLADYGQVNVCAFGRYNLLGFHVHLPECVRLLTCGFEILL
jgi:hypothetical protein